MCASAWSPPSISAYPRPPGRPATGIPARSAGATLPAEPLRRAGAPDGPAACAAGDRRSLHLRPAQARGGERGSVTESPREATDVLLLIGEDEGDRAAGTACPARAADAVHVVVIEVGRVEVEHVTDVVDVEPSGGDVGGDERPDAPGRELG